MATTQEQLSNAFEQTALFKFLGAQEAEELRRGIREAFVERISSDLAEYSYYLFSSDDVQDIINSIAADIKAEIIKEYGEELKVKVKEKLVADLIKTL